MIKIQRTVFFLCLFNFTISCNESKNLSSVTAANKEIDSIVLQKKEWLKQYGLCKCIYEAYGKDTVFKRDASFSVLTEIADFSPNTYSLIDSLAQINVASIKSVRAGDYNNKKALIMKCIEFYKSQMLDSLVNNIKE